MLYLINTVIYILRYDLLRHQITLFWRALSSGIWYHVVWQKFTHVLRKYGTFLSGWKNKARQLKAVLLPRNVGKLLPLYIASYLRKCYFSERVPRTRNFTTYCFIHCISYICIVTCYTMQKSCFHRAVPKRAEESRREPTKAKESRSEPS
jgi:hypothetical protein